MKETELKPCPFCGGEAKIVKTRSVLWTFLATIIDAVDTYNFFITKIKK